MQRWAACWGAAYNWRAFSSALERKALMKKPGGRCLSRVEGVRVHECVCKAEWGSVCRGWSAWARGRRVWRLFSLSHTCVSSSALFIWKCLHLRQQFTSQHSSCIFKWTFPYHCCSLSLPYVSLTLSCLIRHANGVAKQLCAPIMGNYNLINRPHFVWTCMP